MVTKILDAIKQRLKAAGLDAEVSGREKQLYSIYKKMAEKHLTFSEVLDIYGFRVIVKDVPSCYIALGALHSLYNPIPGKFKDYIAIPKANGYQSLHSTLWGPYGTPIEIQIRTAEMHRIAEAGVASHWLYKSTDADLNDLHMKTHQWLQSLLETLSDSTDSLEFLEHLKVDLFPGEVYVFTPQGKILALPERLHSGGFRLCGAYGYRRLLRGGENKWRECAVAHRVSEAATAWRLLPHLMRNPTLPGLITWLPARRAPISAVFSRPCNMKSRPGWGSAC